MKKILMVRALKGYPDSRLEKEAFSLSRKYDVTVLGWNRDENYRGVKRTYHECFGKKIKYLHIGEKAPVGLGFRKLLIPELKYWRKLYTCLKKIVTHYDAVHACDFDTGYVVSKAIKGCDVKFVYDIFDYYAESKVGPKPILNTIKKLENRVISKSDLTIICSEKRKEQIRQAKYKKLFVVHNTPMKIDNESSDGVRILSERPKLVYIGTLSKDRYLEEMASVIIKRQDIEWHVGGWGVLSRFFNELSEKYDNIKFYGEVTYEEALRIESECDIMTALYDPSVENHKYAAPNKFYESLMLGKPLIMMKNTGMDDYISGLDIGEVIDCEPEQWAIAFDNALDSVLNKKSEWKSIKEKSQKLYRDEFSWEKMEMRLLNNYNDLLESK